MKSLLMSIKLHDHDIAWTAKNSNKLSEKDSHGSPSYGNAMKLYNKKSEDILQCVNRLHIRDLILKGSTCA